MTSGTTEKRPDYTKAQMLEMLYLFMRKSSESLNSAIEKATAGYRADCEKVNGKLAKNGITPDEFTKHCMEQDNLRHDETKNQSLQPAKPDA